MLFKCKPRWILIYLILFHARHNSIIILKNKNNLISLPWLSDTFFSDQWIFSCCFRSVECQCWPKPLSSACLWGGAKDTRCLVTAQLLPSPRRRPRKSLRSSRHCSTSLTLSTGRSQMRWPWMLKSAVQTISTVCCWLHSPHHCW